MKKIACFLNDIHLYNSVKNFCDSEDFEMYNFSKETFEYDHGIIVVLTDSYSEIKGLPLKGIPYCLVDCNCDDDLFHYSLNNDFSNIQLRALIDSVYQGGVLGSFTSSLCLNKIHKELIIKNDIFNVDRIVNSSTKELVYFFTISEVQKMRIGISEILTNAIEHGNLNISGDDKFNATEEGTYFDLVEERLSSSIYKDRIVTLTFDIFDNCFTIGVEDSGSGFSVDDVGEGNDPEDLLKLHGRGILITKMYFDEVIYNEKGNKVTLRKRF